jgi:hypothetical protein
MAISLILFSLLIMAIYYIQDDDADFDDYFD